MDTKGKVLFITGCLILAIILPFLSAANDPPHNEASGVGCADCHGQSLLSGQSPFWTDNKTDSAYNAICMDRCHVSGVSPFNGTNAPPVTSHSYDSTVIKCTVCHNNHDQDQIYSGKNNKNAFFVATGTLDTGAPLPLDYNSGTDTTTIAYTTLAATDPSSDWADLTMLAAKTGVGRGAMLVPNHTSRKRWPIYIIKSIDTGAQTIIVKGNVSSAANLGIFYGQVIRRTVDYESSPGVPAGMPKSVKFYNQTDSNAFAFNDTLGGDDSTPNNICQICHTQTNHWRGDGTVSTDGTHSTYSGKNCMICHDHLLGLTAQCDTCHNYPPGALAGLVQPPDDTGSLTAGAHTLHVTTKGYSCDFCHLDSYGKAATHNNGDKKITIGFSLFSDVFQGGSYDGQDTAQYETTTTSPVTSVTNTGTKTCSSLYCHGILPGGANWGGGSDTNPVWDGTVACGDCHRATAASPPTSGQHQKHARAFNAGYNYDCGFCHKDPGVDGSLHGNNKSEVIFSNDDPEVSGGIYNGDTDMLGSYGSCDNLYCHSTIQSSPPGSDPTFRTTPAWNGSMGGCDKCHYTWGSNPGLETGSHDPHFYNDEGQQCYGCHNWEGTDDPCFACHKPDINPSRELHANYEVNVMFSPKYGGSYSGSLAPGDAYGSCSDVYCHGNFAGSGLNATPTWADPPTAACGTCHGSSSGAHSDHISIQGFDCSLCHYDTADGSALAAGTTTHANYAADWRFDPTDIRTTGADYNSLNSGSKSPPSTTYGSCDNLYCHSSVQGAPDPVDPPTYQNPSWSSTLSGCDDCHKAGAHRDPPLMDTGSHYAHVQYRFTQPGNCQACHYLDKGGNLCDACHMPHGTLMSRLDNHVDGNIDVDFLASIAGSSATYSGDSVPQTAYGSCDNIYCHSDGKSVANANMFPVESSTTNWGGSATSCNSCHPSTPVNDSHDYHVNTYGLTCANCHYDTTQDSTTINDKSLHVNGVYDLSPSGQFYHAPSLSWYNIDFVYTPMPITGSTGGQCSSNTCHQTWSFSDPLRWRYDTISSSFGYTESCSGESTVNVTVTSSGGSGTYECSFDWGDGNSDTWGPSVTSHDYVIRDPFTITWQARDDQGVPMSGTIPGVELINVCNEPPVVDFTLADGGGAGRDVVLNDLSYDPDYNVANHDPNVPGEIKIAWDGWNCGAPSYGVSSGVADMTDSTPVPAGSPPYDREHFFRYSSNGNYDVYIAVKDNGGDWVCSIKKRYLVQSASVTFVSNQGSVGDAVCNSLANATVTFPSFQFNAGLENWTAINHLDPLVAGGGILSTATSGIDPYMRNDCVVLNGSDVQTLEINMKTTCGTTGQFFWTTGSEPGESGDKSVNFTTPLIADGAFYTYTADFSGNLKWMGQDIRTLRLDPTNPPDATPCTIEIDYIQAVYP